MGALTVTQGRAFALPVLRPWLPSLPPPKKDPVFGDGHLVSLLSSSFLIWWEPFGLDGPCVCLHWPWVGGIIKQSLLPALWDFVLRNLLELVSKVKNILVYVFTWYFIGLHLLNNLPLGPCSIKITCKNLLKELCLVCQHKVVGNKLKLPSNL